MLSEKERGYLTNILDNINFAEEFASGLTYDQLREDVRTL